MSERARQDLSAYSMLDLFRMEAETQLAQFIAHLLALEYEPSPERWEALLRTAHSIKGAARMVEADAVVSLVHGLEDVLVAAQKGDLELDARGIDVLLQQADGIQAIIRCDDETILTWAERHRDQFARMREQLRDLQRRPETHAGTAPEMAPAREAALKTEPGPQEAELRIQPRRLDRILGLAGSVLVEGHRFQRHLEQLRRIKQKQFALVAELGRLEKRLHKPPLDESGRERLHGISRLAEQCRQQFSDVLAELEAFDRRTGSLIDQLHHEVLSSRMRPFADLVAGLPRLVRDMGRQLGKEARLEMSGLDTLVDRDILERIDVPLKHLLQNAIDHGIEPPERRRALGKPVFGTLRLDVSQSAGMLRIVLSDDGGGVDLEGLRAKLVRLGLCPEEEAAQLDRARLLDYLFVSGVSSRDRVTHYSGRGIGLDVVKQSIDSLQGRVHVTTEPGRGSRFQLLLPLTVSVIKVLQARIAGEQYAFPLTCIHRIVRLPLARLHQVLDAGRLELEGEMVPLMHANTVLGHDLPGQWGEELEILIIGKQDSRAALLVEELLDERELALKSLEPLLGTVPGISAAALLEDGSISLVVDCGQLAAAVAGRNELHKLSGLGDASAAGLAPRVLLADDSPTACLLQKRLLEARGYGVSLAGSGEQAWQALRQGGYDLLICDLDLPGGGARLLEKLRGEPVLRRLPVLVLAARSEEELAALKNGGWEFDYCSKADFEPERYLAQIDNILKQAKHDRG